MSNSQHQQQRQRLAGAIHAHTRALNDRTWARHRFNEAEEAMSRAEEQVEQKEREVDDVARKLVEMLDKAEAGDA